MALELRHLSKVVNGRPHIDDVSMMLEPGTFNILLGPTLSGKTTLMRLMAGLDSPTSGQVYFGRADVTGLPVQKRNVAMVYQQFINYPSLTVYENIASPLRVAGLPAADIDRKVRETAALLRLEPQLELLPTQLSGGQQQRTALARALAKGAELVLLDEPLANLDYKLREELRAELPRIFARSGAIFVYATTEPTEALLLGGRVAALHEGRLVQFGPTLDVYRRPGSLDAARIMSDPPLNTIPAVKRGHAFDIGEGATLPAPQHASRLADGRYTLGVRPHHIELAAGATGKGFAVTVAVAEITGSESFIHVDFEGRRWVALVPGVHNIAAGDTVTMRPDAHRLLVFAPDGALAAAPAGG